MSKSKRVSFAIFAIVVCLFLASSAYSQSGNVPQMVIDNLYLAKGDGSGKPGEATEWFYTSDIPIYVVATFDHARTAGITMKIVAVSVAGMKPESKIISATYKMPEGGSMVWFNGRPLGSQWTAGKYRVDILIDGTVSKSLEFEFRKMPGAETTTTFAPKRISPKKRPGKHLLIFN